MRRRLLACIASAVLLPAATAGSAAADGASVQASGQDAASQQSATSSATATQVQPSNTNISVRIGSPGDSGAVTQSNSSSAASAAGNANTSAQQAAQAAAAAGVQYADQAAASQQSADSSASSTQTAPQNTNISVRIESPGDDGSVTQTNSSDATSAAGNGNRSAQAAGQSGGGSGGTQHVGQHASNDEDASSGATSEQKHPSNVNVPVRIFSPGDDGAVTQTNSSEATSAAASKNATAQQAKQDAPATFRADDACGGGCGHESAPHVQDAEQHAANEQSATSSASSQQDAASNVNAPVRIESAGDGGTVTQSNSTAAESAAGNANWTSQDVAQDAGSGAGVVVQAVGQWASNEQAAVSMATSRQEGACNLNAPVRIKSRGDDGDVDQSNSSAAESAAGNLNETDQGTQQLARGAHDVLVQAIGQKAANDQQASSDASSEQRAPSNDNAPAWIRSELEGGSVEQANASDAASAAGNRNRTWGRVRQQ